MFQSPRTLRNRSSYDMEPVSQFHCFYIVEIEDLSHLFFIWELSRMSVQRYGHSMNVALCHLGKRHDLRPGRGRGFLGGGGLDFFTLSQGG